MKTNRGFERKFFEDDYGVVCSIQESSAVDPHIWLGVHDPDILIMYKDAKELGLDVEKLYPECNECGWCKYPLPASVLKESRMHLNPEQAIALAKLLLYFADNGVLPDDSFSESR